MAFRFSGSVEPLNWKLAPPLMTTFPGVAEEGFGPSRRLPVICSVPARIETPPVNVLFAVLRVN